MKFLHGRLFVVGCLQQQVWWYDVRLGDGEVVCLGFCVGCRAAGTAVMDQA